MTPTNSPYSPSLSLIVKTTLFYGLLLLSWLLPSTQCFWSELDNVVFRALNTTLDWHPVWKIFWAYMNADLFDRLMEILVFGSTFWGLYRLPGPFKKHFAAFFKYYISFTLTFILVKWCLHKGIAIKRLSPTFVFEDAIRLKGLIAYKLKDASRNSFPADHALFLFLMYQYGKRVFDSTVKKTLLIITIIFTLPRLISGGHWMTDALFGAWVPAALFASAWFFKNSQTTNQE